MRFERELPTYAEPVKAETLEIGETYFAVQYLDEELLVPILETLILTDRKDGGDEGSVFRFQDLDSYRAGVRHGSTEADSATFYFQSQHNLRHIFEYEQAVDELIRCALRRRKQKPR